MKSLSRSEPEQLPTQDANSALRCRVARWTPKIPDSITCLDKYAQSVHVQPWRALICVAQSTTKVGHVFGSCIRSLERIQRNRLYRVIKACVICSCFLYRQATGKCLCCWVAGCEVEFLRHLAHLSEDQIFFLDRALLRAHIMSGVYAKSKLVDADTQSCTHCIYKFTCCMRVCLRDRFCLPARAPDQHLALAGLESCRCHYQAHSQRAKTFPNTRAM